MLIIKRSWCRRVAIPMSLAIFGFSFVAADAREANIHSLLVMCTDCEETTYHHTAPLNLNGEWDSETAHGNPSLGSCDVLDHGHTKGACIPEDLDDIDQLWTAVNDHSISAVREILKRLEGRVEFNSDRQAIQLRGRCGGLVVAHIPLNDGQLALFVE